MVALLVLLAAAPAGVQAATVQPAAAAALAATGGGAGAENSADPEPGGEAHEAPADPGLTLNVAAATVLPGKKLQLEATSQPAGTVNKGIAWKSSNKKVATVNRKGVVRGFAEGKTTITAVDAATGKRPSVRCTWACR